VKGTLQTLCAQPPRRHDLTMELQRLVNGTWQNQNTKTINTIPEATVRFNLITAACIPGSWRLHIRINIVSPTGITQVVDKTGDVQEVKPSDCG
jgi:hypothetical protein